MSEVMTWWAPRWALWWATLGMRWRWANFVMFFVIVSGWERRMAFVTVTRWLMVSRKVARYAVGNWAMAAFPALVLVVSPCVSTVITFFFSYLLMCSNEPLCSLMKQTSLSQPVLKVLCYCKFSRALFPLKRLSCLPLMSIPSRCLLAAECSQTCQSKTDLIMFSIKSVTCWQIDLKFLIYVVPKTQRKIGLMLP